MLAPYLPPENVDNISVGSSHQRVVTTSTKSLVKQGDTAKPTYATVGHRKGWQEITVAGGRRMVSAFKVDRRWNYQWKVHDLQLQSGRKSHVNIGAEELGNSNVGRAKSKGKFLGLTNFR